MEQTNMALSKFTPEERFWMKVVKTETCWTWTSTRTSSFGPGQFWDGKRVTLAHHFSYRLHVGDIPFGMLIMHSCDNPICVNPDHLSLGTYADNHADKAMKGRARVRPGTGAGDPIDDDLRHYVLQRFVEDGLSQIEIARSIGCAQTTVSKILQQFEIVVPALFVDSAASERVAIIAEFNQERLAA